MAISPAEASAARRLEVMNFLNEVAGQHPQAISFASGRPAEQFFDVAGWQAGAEAFLRSEAARTGVDLLQARRLQAQYGPTAGTIGELVAQQVRLDEALHATADRIIVTTGAQEALDLCIRVLCPDSNDVILARSPTYIGITGAAHGSRRSIVPVAPQAHESEPMAVARVIGELRADGRRARVLYLSPDYSLGEMPRGDDAAALALLCSAQGVAILEDNPYSLFRFDGARVPPLSALQGQDCALYVGTYSKSICPAVRTGFVVLPASFMGSTGQSQALRQALVQAKSFTTVNTSPFNQALVGGVLQQQRRGLRPLVQPILNHYRQARDTLLSALEAHFMPLGSAVQWSMPRAGFFLTLQLPFAFDGEACLLCVRDHGVITTPLSFFSLDQRDDQALRLAFSNLPLEQIDPGVQRLAAYVKGRLQQAS